MSIRVIRLSLILVAFVIGATAFCFEVPVGAGTLDRKTTSGLMTPTQRPASDHCSRPRCERDVRGRRDW